MPIVEKPRPARDETEVLERAIPTAADETMNRVDQAHSAALPLAALVCEVANEVTELLQRTSGRFSELVTVLNHSTLSLDGLSPDSAEFDLRLAQHSAISKELSRRASPYLEAAITATIVEHSDPARDEQILESIREFFLRPKRMYEVGDVAGMFNVSTAAVLRYLDSITLADLNGPKTPEDQIRAEWSEVVTFVAGYFSASTLEDALGTDFPRALPAAYKTQLVTMRLPQYVIEGICDGLTEAGQMRCSHRPLDLAYLLQQQIGDQPDPYPAFPESE